MGNSTKSRPVIMRASTIVICLASLAALYKGTSCVMQKTSVTTDGTEVVTYSKGCTMKVLGETSGCKTPAVETTVNGKKISTYMVGKTTTTAGGFTENAAAVKSATDAITNTCGTSSASTVAPSMAVAALLSAAALFKW